ncbi:LPXTG cell wall anchor domain-containing protein [Streptomyces sp. SID8359]|uniref:LPXTG cell wall anchor domain-containing protein n=1 Tax=unclassified Streptomyces TaxID=2593676 RepID=UPI00048FCCB2|nr:MULTISPECIES: LPXTG cell wall anchor domain-containing protein [unclassified Streptomyces]MYT91143.1 LPXTG cell wall anchor domain-containing protein [Streptomyces sp. SID8359]
MKIRRALAVAAATAVLAPVTLLSSPAAFASPGPSPEAGESTPATQEEPGTDPEAEQPAPAPEEEQEQEKPATEESEEKPPAEEEKEKPSDEEKEKPKEGAPSPSATPPAPSSTSPADICVDSDRPTTDKNLRTSLSGLPSKVVAGSGFHAFKLNVENKGDKVYDRVDLGLSAFQADTDTWDETTEYLTLQFKNPETGVWTDIVLDEDDDAAGYIGYTGIRAKESFAIDVRLSVDKKAPASLGLVFVAGVYVDDKGNCVFPDGEAYYEFEVLAAGKDAGEPNEAKPQTGGRKPVQAKPVGNTPIKPEGTLAQTGSDSGLPVIAAVGGVAILAGAGVVFALGRRRKADAAV